MLRTVHLHGALGERFGRQHRLDVISAAEAVRALAFQLPGFHDQVRQGSYAVTIGTGSIPEKCVPLDEESVELELGRQEDIHIAPAGVLPGIETIILVGVLAVVAIAAIASVLLPKAPKPGEREEATKVVSAVFDGAENVMEQGHPVPLTYGELLVGSIVGSSGITTADLGVGGGEPPGGSKWDDIIDVDDAGSTGDSSGLSGTVGTTPHYTGDQTPIEFGSDQYVNIPGGGGKGGDAPDPPEEAPNNLQSAATARVLEIISEGPCVGLVKGMESVFLDGTPILNPDGSPNFTGVHVEQRTGQPDQDYIQGFAQTENTVNVNTQVKVGSPGPIIRTINNSDCTMARVTIRVPALMSTDTETGDINGTSVQLAIAVQADGGGYSTVYTMTINGKTTAAYERSVQITLPPGAVRNIRVTRITADATSSALQNDTYWSMLTEIVEAKLSYPDTAMIALTVDARQFGSSIPNRAYLWRGLIVDVPSNYDPVTRLYTGVWNGTFKKAWTQNGAWILRDVIVNRRYGLGGRVPASALDKWALYAIAQHNDGMLPDGKINPQYAVTTIPDLPRDPVRVALRSNVNTGSPGATLDGQAMVAGDRVLLAGQTTANANGIYVWNGAAVAMTRAADNNSFSTEFLGATTYVKQGTYRGRHFKQYRDAVATGDNEWTSVTPRYSVNACINTAMQAYDLIASIAGSFRGMVHWSSGAIVATQDRPEDPSIIITPSNVKDGKFRYGRITPHDRRRSVAVVYFNDPEDMYRLTPAVYEEPDLVRQFGRRTGQEITAFGCTSEGEALRKARWIIEDESGPSNGTVAYDVGDDHAFVEPGRIAIIADPMFAGTRRGGRAASATANTLTLDRNLVVPVGPAYTVRVMMPDGTVSVRAVTSIDEATGLFPNANIGAWAGTAGSALVSGFYQLSDADAGNFPSRNNTVAGLTPGQHLTVAVRVKKDAIGKATRAPQINVSNNGAELTDIQIDTATGEFWVSNDNMDYVAVEDLGTEWLVHVRLIALGVGVAVTLYPAVGQTNLGTYLPALTGSASFRLPQMFVGWVDPQAQGSKLNLGGAAWGTPPNPGAVWAVESDTIANRQFRIRQIETDTEPYAVKAVLHDPTKYDRVELGRDLAPPNYSSLPSGPLVPPYDLGALEYLYRQGDASIPAVVFAWTPGADPRVKFFQSKYRKVNGEWIMLEDSSEASREVRPIAAGDYEFAVRGVDALGRTTNWQFGTATMDGQADSMPEVVAPGLVVNEDLFAVKLTWFKPTDKRPLRYEIMFHAGGVYASAVSVGITDRLEYTVTESGTYWVRTRFIDAVSPAPVAIPVSALIFSAGIVPHLTNDSWLLPASSDGTVLSYSGATGSFVIMSGTTDISSNFTLSTPGGGNPQSLTVNYVARTYTVTAGLDAGEETATLVIRATGSGAYAGVVLDKVFSLGKAKQGSQGNYIDTKFKRSLTQPATPTGNSPAGWTDGIPAGTDTVWQTNGVKTAAGNLIGVWSTPQAITALTHRGAYSASETYYLNNTVTYNGGTYIAVQDNFTGQAPTGTAQSNAYWDVIAAPGAPGEPGTPPSAFSATINLTSGANVNLRTVANANGYTGLSNATITFKVPNGVTIRGVSGGRGIDTGTWPTGSYTIALTIIVESGGIVDGGGGSGGAGNSGAGGPGGHAIYLQTPISGGITINAGGTVRGGGGGGGGGYQYYGEQAPGEPITMGGGGGGGGFPNGAGGPGGEGDFASGGNGNPGTTSGGGSGGGGGNGPGAQDGGPGGAGGNAAAAGANGGGAAGKAVAKNGHAATVTNNGTMTGAAS